MRNRYDYLPVVKMIESGKNVAKLGIIGLFPASYCGLTALTVATAGSVIAAGFVGGMAIYFARNLLLNLMSNLINVNPVLHGLVAQAIDMGSLMFAATAGAWLLGAAITPILTCVAMGVLTLGLINLCLEPMSTIEHITESESRYPLDEIIAREITQELVALPSFHPF